MKIAVIGLWHLGVVTAACLADAGHTVIAYDGDRKVINSLHDGVAPVSEPGLEELLKKNLKTDQLKFTSQLSDLATAEIVWVTFDTPVDANDQADTQFVIDQVQSTFSHLANAKAVLVSSQLPVGSTRRLEEMFAQAFPDRSVGFACSPENLRLGKAIEVFTQPDRIIVGVRTQEDKAVLEPLLKTLAENIIWMSVESAEMTKHALNAFLATSVVFINELASLCERVGADAGEVERGLKSEVRIGTKAYLRAGSAFAGGTLARDIAYLIDIGKQQKLPTQLFSAVLNSNHAHKEWSQRKLTEVLGGLQGKTIAVLGLTYKPGTDTLRRSTAIETCAWLKQQGATITAHDPALKELPMELASYIELKTSAQDALKGADAVMISTECPEFTTLTANDFLSCLKQPFLVDPGGFLARNLISNNQLRYYSVGKQA